MTDEYDPMNPEEGHFERAFNFIAFDEDGIGFEESSRLFNEWLNEERAKAYDEGFDQGHYINPEESRDCGCRENPYRKADS